MVCAMKDSVNMYCTVHTFTSCKWKSEKKGGMVVFPSF